MDGKRWIWLAVLIIFSFSALATDNQPYHLKLLAVQETDGGYEGSEADLYLELKEGSGRVFLETQPLTKMDTQISTRFAKEIACYHFKLDCDRYDFIYTIKAESNIIGGPSAGAAIAALTSIALLDLQPEETMAVTGTINSGGIIGPVGGVKEKLEAASKAGLKKVLVAKGTSKQKLSGPIPFLEGKEESGNDFDLMEYAKNNLSLEVVEVMDLGEALFHLSGARLMAEKKELSEDTAYQKIMKNLQETLCRRTEKIEQELQEEGITVGGEVRQKIEDRQEKARNATQEGNHYSAASFCFGSNIDLKTAYYQEMKASPAAMANLFSLLEKRVVSLEGQLAQEKIETIADLQTMMVVKERLDDVRQQLEAFHEGRKTLVELYGWLAYAEERYFSALSWQQFFTMPGKKYLLNEENLKNSCRSKISEAEERQQYALFFTGGFPFVSLSEEISRAKKAQEKGEFILCLISASQAKADANAILSSLGLSEETVAEFLTSKQKAVELVIAENSAEEVFPILGYSSYQYALFLQKDEPYSALTHLEYALEMGDLGIYFPEKEGISSAVPPGFSPFSLSREWLLTGGGFLVGMLLMLVLVILWFKIGSPKKDRPKPRKRR